MCSAPLLANGICLILFYFWISPKIWFLMLKNRFFIMISSEILIISKYCICDVFFEASILKLCCTAEKSATMATLYSL